MTTRTRFLAACALATLAGFAKAADDDENRIAVTLAEVRAFPETYRRVPFDLALLYHGPRNVYNPFYTVFEPAAFLNFAAWPSDAPIFTRDGFCDDYSLFYVDRKNGELQKQVVALRPMTWFSARCIVRSAAQNRAWIEVLAITQTGPMLDGGDLRHLVRANALAGNGEFDRALLEFEMARLAGAPPRFVARCRGEEGRVALAGNQPERAARSLEVAWQWFPEDKQIAAMLDRATMQVATMRQQQVASVPSGTPEPIRRVDPPPMPTPVVPSVPPSVDPQAPSSPLPEEPKGKPADPKPVEPPSDPPIEPPSETPVEPPAEKPAEPAGEKPADSPAEPASPETTPADGFPKPEAAPEAAPETPSEPDAKPEDGGKPDDSRPHETPPPIPDEDPKPPPPDHGDGR